MEDDKFSVSDKENQPESVKTLTSKEMSKTRLFV